MLHDEIHSKGMCIPRTQRQVVKEEEELKICSSRSETEKFVECPGINRDAEVMISQYKIYEDLNQLSISQHITFSTRQFSIS